MGPNLSAWALRNRPLIGFFALLIAVAGAFAFASLPQSEDPPFTFRAMVIRSDWPGATATQVEQQLTDVIEEKLAELPRLDFVRSYSRPGQSMVFVFVEESTRSDEIDRLWYQVRKKIGDIRGRLPADVQGPFFNDEFGDVYGNLFALRSADFGLPELKRHAEALRLQLLRVPSVAKVDLYGVQPEQITVEISNQRLAQLGLDLRELARALNAQNAVAPTGRFVTDSAQISLRLDGEFESVDAVADLLINGNGRRYRLGDIATVRRGLIEPARELVRVRGEPALLVAVSMDADGNILRLGRALDEVVQRYTATLPLGIELERLADQPKAVRHSIGEFISVLIEALAIVLAVSFFSLGWRSGLVVAASIPFVLAATFLLMDYFAIGLNKISLGALVLALGLLVDDAIIAIEMMAVKLEQGFDRIAAASAAYASTAFPMLTGTLVTAAGFLPIALAQSAVGEYTVSIFQVVTLALLVSWIAAVLLIPYLGDTLLRVRVGHNADGDGAYQGRFYSALRRWIRAAVLHRQVVLLLTVAVFVLAVLGFSQVPQQFFPASTRLELLVDLRLADGSSIRAAEAEAKALQPWLDAQPEVEGSASFIGSGAPRFYLPIDQQLPLPHFAQMVVQTSDIAGREALRERLIAHLQHEFPHLVARVLRLENGPPVGFPVQFRVSAANDAELGSAVSQVKAVLEADPDLVNVSTDWGEQGKVIRLGVDQDQLRQAGLSRADLMAFLNNALDGTPVASYREPDESLAVMLRGPPEERRALEQLASLAIPTAAGHSVPLEQLATLRFGFEPVTIYRRDRVRTVTVRADIYSQAQAISVTQRLEAELRGLEFAPGVRVDTGGAAESSRKAQRSVIAGVPVLVVVVLALLMIQLQNLPRVLLVVLTAPLGLIGVVAFLLLTGMPFGFVAMLGTIALSGMIMRNTVILVDQIEQDIRHGAWPLDAIIEATVRRFRPITLTAAAAVLAMVPLARSVFFGPMAVAIMGGLIVATVLTVLVVPALYAAWFGARAAPENSVA